MESRASCQQKRCDVSVAHHFVPWKDVPEQQTHFRLLDSRSDDVLYRQALVRIALLHRRQQPDSKHGGWIVEPAAIFPPECQQHLTSERPKHAATHTIQSGDADSPSPPPDRPR